MGDITAIVNIFKRGYALDFQIDAIKKQTLKPKCIMIWNNGDKEIDLSKYKNDPFFKVFDTNYNSGVWSRFLIGQLADTEYICILDDDTIPGINWFQNCMTEMNKKEALYGTIGVIFQNTNKYDIYRRYGWDSHNNGNNTVSKPVDIIGHSWFFKKKWISYFTRETPKVNEQFSVGEDIHFSYSLQKYGNIPTYVPPHPSDNITMYGSIPPLAYKYGWDGNSGSNVGCTFDIALKECLKKDFRLLINRQNTTSVIDFQYFIQKIRDIEPFALIRPCDGEYHILKNTTLTNIDNWTFQKGGKLQTDLHDAIMEASNKNCYIGIPGGCCNMEMSKWYISTFQLNPYYTTFANMFVNKNWKPWIEFLINEKIGFHFIGPNKLPSDFMVKMYMNIPLYFVNEWDIYRDQYISMFLTEIKKYKNQIFLFSAGPIAKILVSKAWSEHPYNIYLDVGSSLDLFMKGSTNREYAIEGSVLSNLECKFDNHLIEI